jgi:amino acid transporter
VVVALVIAVVAFAAGGYAARRWAPPLRETPVGRWAAIVVAVLAGAALVVVAMDVYELIRQLDRAGGDLRDAKSDIVAGTIRTTLVGAGTLLGLAAAVHLLAPGED